MPPQMQAWINQLGNALDDLGQLETKDERALKHAKISYKKPCELFSLEKQRVG